MIPMRGVWPPVDLPRADQVKMLEMEPGAPSHFRARQEDDAQILSGWPYRGETLHSVLPAALLNGEAGDAMGNYSQRRETSDRRSSHDDENSKSCPLFRPTTSIDLHLGLGREYRHNESNELKT